MVTTDRPRTTGRTAAIIGAGPAGLYLLANLLESDAFRRVDVFEAVPAPFGLVRYGVAPDHPKTRTITRVLAAGFEYTDAHYFGNVMVGRDVMLDELRHHYDVVVFSTGMRGDRTLGIPGEDLPGSIGASELVAWYTGHPDAPKVSLPDPLRSAVVIGAGNVALDVARILARDPASLRGTSMPRPVVDALAASTLTDVHLVARRGPAQAKFTSPELRELGKLDAVDVVVDSGDLVLDDADQAEVESRRQAATTVKVLHEWSERSPSGAPRRIHLHFWRRPLRVHGDAAVTGVDLEPTRDTAKPLQLSAELLIRAIGYRGRPVEGLPFDDERGIVPSVEGRVVDDGQQLRGVYVTGWLRRGPTGVIGTNRPDAGEVAASILGDLAHLPRAAGEPEELEASLAGREMHRLSWEDWHRLESYEAELGRPHGGDPIVVDDLETVLRVVERAAR
ncbi:FAD-dependent oxidoreductase [Phytoactinopolyspora alkaliphila]|uniref:ferredoxin--NADP(+) reductase n=1 Tax=Phytoactinopolyspora alkaliphila TaxID=1783498 RepID=A0A6N9YLY9_9ACTN|nr:FAD-dependent oxidoreductase [Phytoactinopolyspora alkaliphila]NED95972.1 FAD-dependent oxidoreductase [Phytoactinopolyspora alkaliphila]